MEQNRTYYELNLSQEVVKLQCTYTLFKKVVNILTSVEIENEIDFSVMEKAFNIAVERNDCTRLRFVKKDKNLEIVLIFAPKYATITPGKQIPHYLIFIGGK